MNFVKLFITATILYLGVPSAGLVQAKNRPFDNSRFANVDGVRLHYRHWLSPLSIPKGNIFLVHGFGASTFSWEQVADSLSMHGYEIIAIDVPPFGFSDKSPRLNTSPTFRASLFIQFLENHYPDQKWHLAGHSMGGGIVQAMSLMNSELFESVNFTSASMFRTTEVVHIPIYQRIRIPFVNRFGGQFAENWVISANRIERLLVSAYGQQPTANQIESYLRPLLEPGTAQAILSMRTNNRNIVGLDASEIEIPWIAIWGDGDTWVPLIMQQQLALNKMPNINLHIIENSGHNPHETHLTEFLEIYLDFLEKQEP